jgi:chromosome segregation ATPase
MSDMLKLADRLAGTPDNLVKKSAAAASEFRRLQECEQEFKNNEARLHAQLDMQQQQLAEQRRQLLDETGVYNRERALSDAHNTALEKELTELKVSLRSANESHERDRREWSAEKTEMRNKSTSLQAQSDKKSDLLLESDRRMHALQAQLQANNGQITDSTANLRVTEERLRKAEDALTQVPHMLHHSRCLLGSVSFFFALQICGATTSI